jgi:hypothetical protein
MGPMSRGSVHDAAVAAVELSGAETVLGLCPSGDLDLSGCSDTFERAVGMVNTSLSQMPAVEHLSYSLEVAAFRSLPGHWHTMVDPPIKTPEVGGLESEIETWNKSLAGIAKGVQQRQAGLAATDSGGLDLLRATPGMVAAITEVANVGAQLATKVEDANRQRREAGLEFPLAKTAKVPLDQYTTVEIRALVKFRAARMAAVA